MGRSKPSGKPKGSKDSAFQKKKKKVGKTVLKSNETVISLKTRKIVLTGQHKQKTSDVMYKGKSLAGYLTGTKHTSAAHRTSNLTTLHEMVTTCPSLLEQHAGPLSDRLGVLLQDTEENVRSSALALGKQFLSETNSTKLEPFLNVLCVQLSSGLLHIDKGVQRTTLSFLIHLLDHHLASTLAHFPPLMGVLCTLLKTSKNKPTILLLCQVVFRLLSATTSSGDHEGTGPAVCKGPGVALWKVAGARKRTPTGNTSIVGDIVPLVRSVVPHLETIWLEDAPPQVH